MKNCTVALFSYYLSMSLTTDNSLQIKVIDPLKKTCETFLGTGKPGLSSEEDKVQFDEPGGLCVSPDGQFLYVADTNNQAIRVINLNTKTVSQVKSPFCYNSGSSFSEMLHWIWFDFYDEPKTAYNVRMKRMRPFLLKPNFAYFISTRFNGIFVIAGSSLCLLSELQLLTINPHAHKEELVLSLKSVSVKQLGNRLIPYSENSVEKLEQFPILNVQSIHDYSGVHRELWLQRGSIRILYVAKLRLGVSVNSRIVDPDDYDMLSVLIFTCRINPTDPKDRRFLS